MKLFEDALDELRACVRADESFARELYGALCNMRWRQAGADDADPVSMSWRAAGATVAQLRHLGGCYMEYYCSGDEGTVSDRVRDALAELGWEPVPWPD